MPLLAAAIWQWWYHKACLIWWWGSSLGARPCHHTLPYPDPCLSIFRPRWVLTVLREIWPEPELSLSNTLVLFFFSLLSVGLESKDGILVFHHQQKTWKPLLMELCNKLGNHSWDIRCCPGLVKNDVVLDRKLVVGLSLVACHPLTMARHRVISGVGNSFL